MNNFTFSDIFTNPNNLHSLTKDEVRELIRLNPHIIEAILTRFIRQQYFSENALNYVDPSHNIDYVFYRNIVSLHQEIRGLSGVLTISKDLNEYEEYRGYFFELKNNIRDEFKLYRVDYRSQHTCEELFDKVKHCSTCRNLPMSKRRRHCPEKGISQANILFNEIDFSQPISFETFI